MRALEPGREAVGPAESGPGQHEGVEGERSAPSVARARSLQSRVSSILACALMLAVGGAMLTWYYTKALARPGHLRRSVQSTLSLRAQSEMPLPPLENVDSRAPDRPKPSASVMSGPTAETAEGAIQPATASVPLSSAQQSQWSSPQSASLSYRAVPLQYVAPTNGAPRQTALERRLSGPAFSGQSAPTPAPEATAANAPSSSRSEGEWPALLKPDAMPAARAAYLPAPRFLLPKGTFIDCTLETAIDSTLPGMTACITAIDTFGADGKVVLLERGTKLIGETRGQVQQGAARVFVLWTEARTPAGVIVPLDSPGTDELGRSGLPGQVDRHFWERFGAAILISTLDGAVQAAVQSASRGSGAVIYSPATSEGIVTDVLKGTVNIPPTVTKQNGDRIQVFVARDLDFRSVYELRTAPTSR